VSLPSLFYFYNHKEVQKPNTMKATINGITLEGTPTEMKELITTNKQEKITAQKLLQEAVSSYKKRKNKVWKDSNKVWSKARMHDIYTFTEEMLLNGTHITEIDSLLAKKYNVTPKTISVKRSQAGASLHKIMYKHNMPVKRGKQ
jgi:hypothetical protein